MTQKTLHRFTVASADAEHPRQSEGDILEHQDGSFTLAWLEFTVAERSGGDDTPNYLVTMVSRDGGFTWTDKQLLLKPSPDSVNVFSPSFCRLPNGEVLLVYYENQQIEKGKPVVSRGMLCRSQDDGRTFGAPVPVWSDTAYSNANGNLRRLSTGRLVWPVDRFLGELWTATDRLETSCLYSDDNGRTWHTSRTWVSLPMRGCMESSVVELRDGRLLMVMRTQLGAVFQSWSDDGGERWSKPQTTGLPAPESTSRIDRIPSTGDLLMVWNRSLYDPGYASHYGKRTPLTVAISQDEGQTWGRVKHVEDDPQRAFTNPSCCFTRDNRLILNYWTCPYRQDAPFAGRMRGDRIDLRLAIIDIDWFYD